MMDDEVEGPKRGHANALYWLGQQTCPECRADLEPAGNSALACPDCDATYPVGGGVP